MIFFKLDIIEKYNEEYFNEINYILEFISENDFQDSEIYGYTITYDILKLNNLERIIEVNIINERRYIDIQFEFRDGVSSGTILNGYDVNEEMYKLYQRNKKIDNITK